LAFGGSTLGKVVEPIQRCFRREEGILKGIEKRTLEIAKEMKDSNLDIKLIEKITGLSPEEIRKL